MTTALRSVSACAFPVSRQTSRMIRVAVVVMLLSGCMTTTGTGDIKRELLRFDRSEPQGAGWKRIQTAEYELFTDLAPALAQRAALTLSQSLSGLRAMFGQAPVAAEQKLTVIAMNDSIEFERRFGRLTQGLAFYEGDEVTICLYGPPDRWFARHEISYGGTQSVVIHELAHAVLHRYFVKQTRWFAEGMAQYLETFQWLDAETLRLGDPNLAAYRTYRGIRSLNLEDLRKWNSMNERDLKVAGLYGLSWAFVHYARNREAQKFGHFLADTARAGPDQAFEDNFGGRGEELDKAIFTYMKQGNYSQTVIKVPLPFPEAVLVEHVSTEVEKRIEAKLAEIQVAQRPGE